MAATDKLIPTALLLTNNLKCTRYSTSGTYKLPAKKISKYQNPCQDIFQFLGSIYAKELKVANSNELWNFEMNTLFILTPKKIQALYTPNRNVHDLNLATIVAVSEAEWNELQVAISKVCNIINIAYFMSVCPTNEFNTNIGIFNKGTNSTATLISNADGSTLGVYSQGVAYTNAWNTVKIPYDRARGYTSDYYLAPILNQNAGIDRYYYRYTGVREWISPFTGFDQI